MDCIDGMKLIDDKSIDMILTDLPYGVSSCSWDTPINLPLLWGQYRRILKDKSAVVLTSQQPFTTTLICSNREWFKYAMVWQKTKPSNFLNAKNRPLGIHEDILVFSNGTIANKSASLMKYNPQMQEGTPYKKFQKTDPRTGVWDVGNRTPYKGVTNNNFGTRYPQTIIKVSNPNNHSVHPTQKPVELFRYLIKTYSNKDDLILDGCIGSGTTAVAAKSCGRNFIGFETSQEYCDISNKRVLETI